MAVSDSAFLYAVSEHFPVMFKKGTTHLSQKFPGLRVEEPPHKGFQLSKVFFHVEKDHFGASVTVDLHTSGTAFKEGCQESPEPPHLPRGDPVFRQETGEAHLIGQLAHFYCIFHRFLPMNQGESTPGSPIDFHDLLVHAPTEPSVESDFLEAAAPPFLQGAKVQKAEIHRLLELVNPASREEDRGNMRVHALNGGDLVGVKGGVRHGPADFLERLERIQEQVGHGMVRQVISVVLCGHMRCGYGWIRSSPRPP